MPSRPALSAPGADRDIQGGAVPYLRPRAVIHGAAFAVMCLWMRIGPGDLRRRLAPEADPD